MRSFGTAVWNKLIRNWSRISQVITLIVTVAVVLILVRLAKQVDWHDVYQAAHDTPRYTLAMAAAMAALGYLVYAGMDVLSRRHLAQPQKTWQTLAIAATSYAFNSNVGVILGGAALRLRLYRKVGLGPAAIVSIVLLTSFNNWLGYAWMGFALALDQTAQTLSQWHIGAAIPRIVGVALVFTAVTYLVLTALLSNKPFSFKGHDFTVPSLPMAFAQSVMAIGSWNAMSAIVYLLLQQQVPYFQVLGLMMFSSFAAMIAHIPAGIGVIEAVFIGALGNKLPTHSVLAAILMFRALYQWAPLCLAVPALLGMEIRMKGKGAR